MKLIRLTDDLSLFDEEADFGITIRAGSILIVDDDFVDDDISCEPAENGTPISVAESRTMPT